MIKKKWTDIYHYIDGKLPKVNEMCIGKIKIVKFKSKGKINKRIYIEIEV
jgi:misacylated tRNA(Ala) deacylase